MILPFICHYIHRDLLYPIWNPSKKPVPLEIVISAFTFTSFNGYLQSKYFLDSE